MKVSEYYLQNEVFDQLLQSQVQSLEQFCLKSLEKLARWVFFEKCVIDTTTGYLWPNLNFIKLDSPVFSTLEKIEWSGTSGWRLPTKEEAITMVHDRSFPFCNTAEHHISSNRSIKTSNVGLWLDRNYPGDCSEGITFPCTSKFSCADAGDKTKRIGWFLNLCRQQGWVVNLRDNPDFNRQFRVLLLIFLLKNNTLYRKDLTKQDLLDLAPLLEKGLLESDQYRANHQVWEYNQLTDLNRGMWEFFSPSNLEGPQSTKIELKTPLEARNPERDIRIGSVAIDFGTSSTTVAYKEHGQIHLLRVGVSDFFKDAQIGHYENPTILEFNNLPTLLVPWGKQAYRPLTHWGDVHCSHHALNDFRNKQTDAKVVGSMFTRIKQWALRTEEDPRLRLVDQDTGTEWEFEPLQECYPVKGEPMQVSEKSRFDPIELYAYYLGLFINHRAHGIFLNYYMTFPVKYPIEIKRKILSSFSRGLQRSLPEALLSSIRFADFKVVEQASEPSAYAACVLETLKIEPTEEGISYAVFDFGGGTTDFDYGLYRLPTTEEIEEGYEHVLEHFGSGGDVFLGGENLIDHLAYRTFEHNQGLCREKRITFTKPLDALSFPGSETLISNSRFAVTNMAMMIAVLRPIWENYGKNVNDSIHQNVKLSLLDDAGNKVPNLEFKVNSQDLLAFLEQRIRKGILSFYIGFKQAFASRKVSPVQVHLFLAGNSCRSLLVRQLFGLAQEANASSTPLQGSTVVSNLPEQFPEVYPKGQHPEFIIYEPLEGDPKDPEKPTIKTGVAIGLLKVIPGEPLKVINASLVAESGETPFQYYVGRFVRKKFQPSLNRNDHYGTWKEMGVPPGGSLILAYTSSLLAVGQLLERGNPELKEVPLEFYGDIKGKKIFVKAIAPNEIQVCLANSVAEIQTSEDSTSLQRRLILT